MNRSAIPAALAIAGIPKGKPHVGPIISSVAGRHDEHPIDVPPESYVLPADIVSALGEGNTLAGMRKVEEIFGPTPRLKVAKRVPIIAAGGEVVITPEQVARKGGGDIKKGHAWMKKFVEDVRKKHIKTLRKLPGPAK